MAQFDWVNFYKAFAKALLQYKDKRSDLIQIIKTVYEEIEINLPVRGKVILQSQGKEFFTWHGKDFFT